VFYFLPSPDDRPRDFPRGQEPAPFAHFFNLAFDFSLADPPFFSKSFSFFFFFSKHYSFPRKGRGHSPDIRTISPKAASSIPITCRLRSTIIYAVVPNNNYDLSFAPPRFVFQRVSRAVLLLTLSSFIQNSVLNVDPCRPLKIGYLTSSIPRPFPFFAFVFVFLFLYLLTPWIGVTVPPPFSTPLASFTSMKNAKISVLIAPPFFME